MNIGQIVAIVSVETGKLAASGRVIEMLDYEGDVLIISVDGVSHRYVGDGEPGKPEWIRTFIDPLGDGWVCSQRETKYFIGGAIKESDKESELC